MPNSSCRASNGTLYLASLKSAATHRDGEIRQEQEDRGELPQPAASGHQRRKVDGVSMRLLIDEATFNQVARMTKSQQVLNEKLGMSNYKMIRY